MLVSSKVTDLVILTAADLAYIGNYLEGVGAVSLAIIVFTVYTDGEKNPLIRAIH
jgi:hypothetical protein